MAPKTCSARPSSLLAQAVLIMASSVSVSALTLSDFQSIATSTVPLGCILAYNNAPLLGCIQSDFTAGRGCSSNCVRSLRLAEATLQIVCADASAPAGSVLRAAMQGSLVDTLCGRGREPPQTTSTRPIAQPIPQPPTSLLPPPPVSTTRRPLASPSVSTTRRPPPPPSTSSASASRSLSAPQPAPPSLTPVPVPVPGSPPPSDSSSPGTETTERPSPTDSDTPGPGETTTASPNPPGQGGQRGGGSPFDPIVASGAQQRLPARPIAAVLAWASVIVLLNTEGAVL